MRKIEQIFSYKNTIYILAGLIVIYSIISFLHYPETISSSDEFRYILQAIAFTKGTVYYDKFDLTTWQWTSYIPSAALPGNSFLIAIILKLGNWKLIYLLPYLCFVSTATLTALVLRKEKIHPLFAILVLTSPIAIIFSRLVMNDMQNLFFVTLSLAIFWLMNERPKAMFFSGLLAGFSLIIRHTNILVFFPFFAIHILKRRNGWIYLILGSFLGFLPRMLYDWHIYGSPIHFEPNPQGFGFARFYEHIIFYGAGLNMVLPGLPLIALFYRGKFRWQLLSACVIFFLFYCYFQGGAHTTAFTKRIVIANRYMLPIIPLLIIATSETLSRWGKYVNKKIVLIGVIIFISLTPVYLHFLIKKHDGWVNKGAEVQKLIYDNTTEGSVIIHNQENVRKYLLPFAGKRYQYGWRQIEGEDLINAIEHGMEIYTVFNFRDDRGWFNDCAKEFLDLLEMSCGQRPILTKRISDQLIKISKIEFCWDKLKPVKRDECMKTTPPASWSPD